MDANSEKPNVTMSAERCSAEKLQSRIAQQEIVEKVMHVKINQLSKKRVAQVVNECSRACTAHRRTEVVSLHINSTWHQKEMTC